jgi:hypothetical protein
VTSELDTTFPREPDRELVRHRAYQVMDWATDQRITNVTVELVLGFDGYQQLADDAAIGRRIGAWRRRNPELDRLLDAEAALDALASRPDLGA